MDEEKKRIILSLPDHPNFGVVRDLDDQVVEVFASKERDGERSLKIGGRTLKLSRRGERTIDGRTYEVWRAWSISG